MDFARFRRSIPRLLSATLFSAAAIGAFSGCSGSGDDNSGSLQTTTTFSVSATATGFVAVSDSGDITAVVDTVNNVIDVYNTSGAPGSVSLLTSVDINTLRILSTDANPVFKDIDSVGVTAGAANDTYDAPGDDVVGIGAVAIHPSDEYMVVGINDADDNAAGSITRSPSRLLWVSLVDIAQDVDGTTAAVLPTRSAGDYIGVTTLSETDGDINANDGDINFFNVTGIAFSPTGIGMGVIGTYPDAIDLGAGGGAPDGDFTDADDIGAAGSAAELEVNESTIAFFGRDGFAFGGNSALPTTAEAVRNASFDGAAGTSITVANFGVDLGAPVDSAGGAASTADHSFDHGGGVAAPAVGTGRIAVLAPDQGQLNSWHLNVVLEDARDTVDDHDAGNGGNNNGAVNAGVDEDAGVSLTGAIIPGSNVEGAEVGINNARGIDSIAIPQASSFVAGHAVSDGAGAVDNNPNASGTQDAGLSTDVLFAFVGQINGVSDVDAVFITGFGLRGDLQARVANGASTFGEASFIGNGTDKLAVAVSISSDEVKVFPINTVSGSENYLYGELLDGTSISQQAFDAGNNLGLSDLVGYSDSGNRLFFAVVNSTTKTDVLGVYEISYEIGTASNGAGGFDVLDEPTVTVVSANYGTTAGADTAAAGPGASSIGRGNVDSFAVLNENDDNVAFVRP